MCFRLYGDLLRPFLNISRTHCERSKLAKYYMDDTDFFPTETITVPIDFRMFAIA